MLFDRIKNSKMFRPLLEEVRKQNSIRNDILKAMSFNSTIVDSPWLKYKSFSPGLWACDYGLLYTLYRSLSSMKPKCIAEFGLGQSSKMVHQYAAYYNAEAITYEHDEEWVKFFNEGRDGDYDIQVRLLELETIQYKGFETVTYKGMDTNPDGTIVPCPHIHMRVKDEGRWDAYAYDIPAIFGNSEDCATTLRDFLQYCNTKNVSELIVLDQKEME